ncbi:hypothetical protein D3C83_268060 [compost metagenome]
MTRSGKASAVISVCCPSFSRGASSSSMSAVTRSGVAWPIQQIASPAFTTAPISPSLRSTTPSIGDRIKLSS